VALAVVEGKVRLVVTLDLRVGTEAPQVQVAQQGLVA
jgi:hypothetical protein